MDSCRYIRGNRSAQMSYCILKRLGLHTHLPTPSQLAYALCLLDMSKRDKST